MLPHATSLLPRHALVASALFLAATLAAADKPAEKTQPADDYPLKTCVVSDESLGAPGDYITYVHKEAGKPDRVVRFCCDGCIDDFKADPAKYLAKLDAAAKGKPAPAKKTETKPKSARE